MAQMQELTHDEALRALATSREGLDSSEASRRLAEYGPNRVEAVHVTPRWRVFLAQFTHLFAVLLWIAAALAGLAEWRQPGLGMGMLACAIVLVILVNGVFAYWQDYRSGQAIRELQRMLPNKVVVRRDGKLIEALGEELVPGDIIRLREGDPVPGDCRLIHAIGVQVSLAALTGESVPVARDERIDTIPNTVNARDILPAGSLVVSGQAEAVVYATGMRTMLGGVARATQLAGDQLSPLQREVARLSRIIAILSIGLGVSVFMAGLMLDVSLVQASVFAIGLTVANVPEGLLPSLTLALAMVSQRLARRNVLVRRLTAVETLGSATVICTDKTGTLTENRMEAREVYVGGSRHDISAPALEGRPGQLLCETARSCQCLTEIDGSLVGDPTEIALVELAGGRPGSQPLDGIPFDSDRRRMSLLYEEPEGLVLHVKGALEAILPRCVSLEDSSAQRRLTNGDRAAIRKAEDRMAHAGLRVLAFARRTVPATAEREHWESELIFLGLVGLEDPPRPETFDAVRQCQAAGIRVVMVTGDHARTAEAIARRIGLATSESLRVIVGDEIERMSNTQLQLALDTSEVIFARARAEQKLRIVEALQAKGNVVAVTGDGVNDAPALRQADIGIAMGASGTAVAREAADMVLLDDNFAGIVAAISEGRTVFSNIRKFLTYILTSNVAELAPFLAFAIFGLPLGLTIAQVLIIDLGTDMLPALALAIEKPEADVMSQPPRSRNDRLVNGGLLARAYGFLGVLEGSGGMVAFLIALLGAGWVWGTTMPADLPAYRQATTICLATIVVMQMANLFACRSQSGSIMESPLCNNPLVLLSLAFETCLILAIVYSPAGNLLFATTPIPIGTWGFAAVFAGGFLLAEEVRKWVMRMCRSARTNARALA